MEQTHEICPYPNCHLDVDHDGDHDFKRPLKPRALTLVQTFNAHVNEKGWRIRCEMHALATDHIRPFGPVSPDQVWAIGLYQDEFGYAWELCGDCAKEGGATDELPGHRPPDKAVSKVCESAPRNRAANGRRISVVR